MRHPLRYRVDERRLALSSWRALGDNSGMNSKHRGYRFPPQIISRAVWYYHRFQLSFRDIEDLLAERGIIVSYEAIRLWCAKFGPDYANSLRKRKGRLGDTWYLDEMVVVIGGQRHFLWRAVDQDGDVIDILLQRRKDKCAAKRFFRKILMHQGETPRRMITDKLRSYAAARREIMPSVEQCQNRYANNRCEGSHQHTRQHERRMRRFKSVGQAQRFLAVHSRVHNLFRLGRNLVSATHYRLFRDRAFAEWRQVTCVW